MENIEEGNNRLQNPLIQDQKVSEPISKSFIYKNEFDKIYYKSYLINFEVDQTRLTLYQRHSSTLPSSSSSNGSPRKTALSLSHDDDGLLGCSYKCLQRQNLQKTNVSNNNTVYEFSIFYYPVKNESCFHSNKDGKVRYRSVVRLYFYNCEASSLENLKAILLRIVHRQLPIEYTKSEGSSEGDVVAGKSKKFLVFVNPVSGKKKALKMWEKTVKGMLEEANVKVELVITQYAFHAKEYVANHKALLSSFDAILPIGGDGILAEVINGIVHRPDGQDVLHNLPIIPIPGGTSNGISRSLLFQIREGPSELNAIYNVIKGKSSPMDLSKVLTSDGKAHYAFLMLSWGLIADIDIKSEVLRCLGEVRLHLFAVYFMMRKHLYRGRLKMKLIPKPTYTDPEFLSKISVNKILPGDVVEDAAIEREESGISEDGAKWITIEGDFVMLTILQASHLSTSVHFGPGVRLDDGAFTVYLAMGNTSRLQMLGLLLSSDGGGHVYSPAIRIFQCTEYILEPLTTAGLYSLDGEVVQYGRIEGKVMPSAARILLNTP